MASGRICCVNEYNAYFLKASELNQKFSDAKSIGRESAVTNLMLLTENASGTLNKWEKIKYKKAVTGKRKSIV